MLSKIDLTILSELRKNARKSLVKMSKETNIPVSTIFDRMGRIERQAIKKYTSLLDYSKLNHNIIINYAIKISKEKKETALRLLGTHSSVNSVYRINNGFDFLIECIFMDFKQKELFEEKLNELIDNKKEFNIIEEIKREGFLTAPEHMDNKL